MPSIKEFVKAEILKDITSDEQASLREEMMELAKTPEGRRVLAEIVIEDITRRYEMVDTAMLLGDVRTYNIGDDPKFKTRKGLRGTVHAHGSYAERTQWSAEWVTFVLDLLSVNPEALLFEIQSGRFGTLADLQAEAIDAARKLMGANIFSTLEAAITSGDNYGTITKTNWEAAGTTAVTAIKTAIRYVMDKGGVQAVVGRFPAIIPITDFDHGFDPEANAQRRLQGQLGTYLGAPLVYLDECLDRDDAQLIPSDVLFVIPKKEGIITGYIGDFAAEQNLDTDTLVWNMHIYRQFGVALVNTDRIYKMDITS